MTTTTRLVPLFFALSAAMPACNSDPAARSDTAGQAGADSGSKPAQAGGSAGTTAGAGGSAQGSGGSRGEGGTVTQSGGAAGSTPTETTPTQGDAAAGGGPSLPAPSTNYKTSCAEQHCEAGDTCVDGGYGGTYCARPCPGQRLCPSGVSYCEHNGGVICVPN